MHVRFISTFSCIFLWMKVLHHGVSTTAHVPITQWKYGSPPLPPGYHWTRCPHVLGGGGEDHVTRWPRDYRPTRQGDDVNRWQRGQVATWPDDNATRWPRDQVAMCPYDHVTLWLTTWPYDWPRDQETMLVTRWPRDSWFRTIIIISQAAIIIPI